MPLRAASSEFAGVVDTAAGLSRLRSEFDSSFAVEPTLVADDGDMALAIQAGAQSYLIRLNEIAAIHECPKIVSLPASDPAFLGLVGLRGRLHGVFRLSTLLGLPIAPNRKSWLILAIGQDAPAFVVDEIEACISFTSAELRPLDQPSDHVRAVFMRDSIARNVLHLSSLVARVTASTRRPRNPAHP